MDDAWGIPVLGNFQMVMNQLKDEDPIEKWNIVDLHSSSTAQGGGGSFRIGNL